ncbi:MAG: diguanylate cyclase [Pseudoduganella sp.]|jgi:diguanylate cyclase (GGDEF)-like protein|nr:diguanylate cyclase [Pseudoduganella sp.]
MANAAGRRHRTGLFLHPDAARRQEFLGACAESFDRLLTADSIASARYALAQNKISLLVIDLHGAAMPAGNELAALVRSRAGAPVLVLCPYTRAATMAELMAQGALAYRITPLASAELRDAVAALLAPAADTVASAQQHLLDREAELNDLLAIQRSLQRALYGSEALERMGARICNALCSYPGICHAALLRTAGDGTLQLVAQDARVDLDLHDVLAAHPALFDAPAQRGEMLLFDAPAKAGDADLAALLEEQGVHMLLAMPLRGEPGGPLLGAVSMLFDRPLVMSREHFSCFGSAAQLISFGLVMSELRQQNDALGLELTQITPFDGLTGVANRRQGEQVLDAEIRRARRYGVPLAVLAFDIDSFRTINELYGYTTGDRALTLIAGMVQTRLRSSDTLARMRGEQFMVVATHTVAIDAFKLAEELRLSIAATALPGADTVTASFSVAQLAPDEGASELVARLEAALHRAKRAGRNCVELAMAR